MKTSKEALTQLVKRFEGLRLKAYPDPATGGKPYTIGYGHTKGVSPSDAITEDEANAFLEKDIAVAEDVISRLVRVPLTQNQFDALADFIFNLGETKFRFSTLLGKLNRSDFDGAADEFPKWKFAANKVMPGLVARRAAERSWFKGEK